MRVASIPWFLAAAALAWLGVLAAVWWRRDARTPDRFGRRELTTFGGAMGGMALGSAAAAVLLLVVGLNAAARPFGAVTLPLEILAALWLVFAAVTVGCFIARVRHADRPADWRRVQCQVEEKVPTPNSFRYLFRYNVGGVQRSFLRTTSYQLQDLSAQWVWVDVNDPGEIRDDASGPPAPSGPFLRNVAWLGPGLAVVGLTIPIAILLALA